MVCFVYVVLSQLELPQDKFLPPDGWKFEGGWQKKPELRYILQMIFFPMFTSDVPRKAKIIVANTQWDNV